ncbi:hypothetical protein FJ364_04650, partial [Candidatus Dependentiae bacterium]|nr:hypothetical protein [Candidatus Dependentiae bacterium]
MKLRELPIGIQTFELIRKKGTTLVYVDKTQEIYELTKGGEKRYFLARPRRFGKSLLCSTLKSLFQARKDLFEGLFIAATDWQWDAHPVIHLSFAGITRRSPEELRKGLIEFLQGEAQQNSITIDPKDTLTRQFTLLIKALAERNKVVIIIDEYDKPILDHITNLDIANQMREILKELYEAVKDLDQYLRFVFITGVTKFAKTSIFSGINNLQDISLSPITGTICGFTHEEIIANFPDFLVCLAKEYNLDQQECLQKFKHWYNGYCFNKKKSNDLVFNPFSVL